VVVALRGLRRRAGLAASIVIALLFTVVVAWSRELIDAALTLGGSYYLAYQLNTTDEQFLRAYPRAYEFLALKRRVDPTGKFRNALWNRYYQR